MSKGRLSMILSQTREKMANEQENFSLPQNQYHCSRIQGKFLLFFIFFTLLFVIIPASAYNLDITVPSEIIAGDNIVINGTSNYPQGTLIIIILYKIANPTPYIVDKVTAKPAQGDLPLLFSAQFSSRGLLPGKYKVEALPNNYGESTLNSDSTNQKIIQIIQNLNDRSVSTITPQTPSQVYITKTVATQQPITTLPVKTITTNPPTTPPTIIPTVTTIPTDLIKNALNSISQAQEAISANAQYDQSAATQELDRARQYFNAKDYSNAITHAQIAYNLANEDEQKQILFLFFGGFIGLIIIISIIRFDQKRCTAIAEIAFDHLDITFEGEEARTNITVTIRGKFRTMSCPVTLNGEQKTIINEPGRQTISFGILPVGKYEVAANCSVRQIRYGSPTFLSTTSFEVKSAVPKLNIDAEPCGCDEGDIATVNVNISNVSPFPAIFREFTITPGESHRLTFSIRIPAPGTVEQTERLEYSNTVGGKFSLDIPLRCTVKPVVPAVDATFEPVDFIESENTVAKISLKNTSIHDAIFRDFTLKPNESRTIDVPLDTRKPGHYDLKYSLEFRDRLGRSYQKEIMLTFDVRPIEPVLKFDVTAPDCLEGEECSAKATLLNISQFDAIGPDFTLKPKEQHTIWIPLDTGKPGKQMFSHSVEFKNKLGVTFRKEIVIPYIVKPVEPLLDSEIETQEYHEGETASATIILKNTSPFDAVFPDFTIRPDESRRIDVPLDTTQPGSLTVKYILTYKNKYGREFTFSVRIPYSVTPIEPVIEEKIESPECYAGDKAVARLTVTNVSVYDAIFDTFTLKPDTSMTMEIPLNTASAGERTVTYTLEFTNVHGRRFTKDVKIQYKVQNIPRPSLSMTADLMENTEGFIRIEAVNPSAVPLQAFRVWLETPDDFDVERRELKLEKFNPGERRTLSLKAKSPYGGDYAVTVKATWIVNGKEREQQMSAMVTVNSPVVSTTHGQEPVRSSPQPSPKDLKAAKARMPAERPGAAPPASTVIPIQSVTEGAKCQICLTEFSSAEPGAVKCPHCGSEFHYRCITKWVNKQRTCPICKKELRV
jgi:hypothetical protein